MALVVPRTPKTIPVAHTLNWNIETNYTFIFLPIGYAYNKHLNDARVGDTIKFVKGKTRVIRDIGFIDIHSFLFRNLCWKRYGCSAERVLRQWEVNARSEGYPKGAIDEDKAVMIWYKVDEDKPIYSNDENDRNEDNYDAKNKHAIQRKGTTASRAIGGNTARGRSGNKGRRKSSD